MVALFFAAMGGFISFVLSGGWLDYWQGGTALGVVIAGFGWLIGAALGLIKAAPPQTRRETMALIIVAACFLLAGFTHWWATDDIVPPASHHLRFEALEQAIRLDSIIAAVTCVALAQRRFRREALVLGGVLAVGLAITSAVLFATGPCAMQPVCPGPKL